MLSSGPVFDVNYGSTVVKNLPANAGDVALNPGWGSFPGEGNGNTPVFLPGKFHGQRSLTGYNPWGHKELDTTKRLSTCKSHLYKDL